MPAWPEGIPTVIAVCAAAVGSAATALGLARIFGLQRALDRAGPTIQDPQLLITRCAELAQIAKQEGVLSVEQHVDPRTESLLACGVALAVNGAEPEVIRDALEAETLRLMAFSWRRAMLNALARTPQLFLTSGAAILVIQMVTHASDPLSVRMFAAGTGVVLLFGSMIGLTLVDPGSRKNAATPAEKLLLAAIQSEAAVLIAQGRDAAAVRTKLLAMLPPSSRGQAHLAEAA